MGSEFASRSLHARYLGRFSRGFSRFSCHKFHSTISPYSFHFTCPCNGMFFSGFFPFSAATNFIPPLIPLMSLISFHLIFHPTLPWYVRRSRADILAIHWPSTKGLHRILSLDPARSRKLVKDILRFSKVGRRVVTVSPHIHSRVRVKNKWTKENKLFMSHSVKCMIRIGIPYRRQDTYNPFNCDGYDNQSNFYYTGPLILQCSCS